MIKRYIYIFLGFTFVAMAIIGAFVPLLPSTPFGLLAVFFFSRSSPFLHQCCLDLPLVGKAIKDWQVNKAISPFSKTLAVSFLLFSLIYVLIDQTILVWIKSLAVVFNIGLSFFIISRKSISNE